MKYVFICNPVAGNKDCLKDIQNYINHSEFKDECSIYVTKAIGDGIRYVRQWCQNDPVTKVRFIACGGDGTISEVITGTYGFKNASVSCYPCGSGNDFVKVFGADKFMNPDALLKAPEQPLDLMKVDDRFCNNVLNFGFDATVAEYVNSQRLKKGHGSKSSYTAGIVKAIFTSMKTDVSIYADGKLLNPSGTILLATLSNGQYVGGSFRCAPKARTDDGLIEVCVISPMSRLKLVSLIPVYTKGEHLDDPALRNYITYTQAKKVEIQSKKKIPFSIDGEIIYSNHLVVEIIPGAIKLAVPE